MAIRTKIQWATATHNFWSGCKKVSAGCKFCYAEREIDGRWQGKNGRFADVRRIKSFHKPLSWKKPERIFTCSFSDFFIQEADEWRAEAWEVIRKTPQHTWLILTKRPERVLEHLPQWWTPGTKNVWIGITIEDNKALMERQQFFDQWKGIIATRFVSFEPLIGDTEIEKYLYWREDNHGPGLPWEWGIIGGESGFDTGKWRYRPCQLKWIEDLVAMHKATQTPAFVKQMGSHLKRELGLKDQFGGDMEEWADFFRVREFPHGYKEPIS